MLPRKENGSAQFWELLEPHKNENEVVGRERFWSSWSQGSRERFSSCDSVRSLIQIDPAGVEEKKVHRFFSISIEERGQNEECDSQSTSDGIVTSDYTPDSKQLRPNTSNTKIGNEMHCDIVDGGITESSTTEATALNSSLIVNTSFDVTEFDEAMTPKFNNKSNDLGTNGNDGHETAAKKSTFWPWKTSISRKPSK